MSASGPLRCPKCGTIYNTEEALVALLENEGYCVAPNCGTDVASLSQDEDEDVWVDFFGDGKIDGDLY
ncbi:MAG: hypothetical protein AB1696_15490 [Planctomycetota bacterium]